ncbi:hypothetical protein C0989_008855 [Termitomyces sp. Mn162]|nr:hypothetical protein C0989_008855 [Termitomyces sp. Mn162]
MIGNDTSTIPPTILNYLSAIRARTGNSAVRLRVGGNSMDSSVYVPELMTPMIQNISTDADSDNQPVNYGPMLWNVMKKVGDNVGGADYLIGMWRNSMYHEVETSQRPLPVRLLEGLSLLNLDDPNVPIIAGT